MKTMKRNPWVLLTLTIAMGWAGNMSAGDTPTVAEQISGLEKMCAETAEVRAQRQAEKPLYFRLGEYDRVLDLTTEIVRLHFINDALTDIMADIDGELLAKNVADFVSTGTGGPKVYTGRDIGTAHARFNMTDADFLAAGGDVMKAMQNKGYGQEEIDEFVCILVSMKDLVVVH